MPKEQQRVRFGLRPKLFLLVLISFGVLMALIVWRIGVEADRVANREIDRALQRSTNIVRADLENRYRAIQETAISLSRDGRILPRVYEGDARTLQDLTGEFHDALEFDILIFTDQAGQVIARSDNPGAIGQSVQGRSYLFDEALLGRAAQGIMLSKGELLQIVAVPVFDNVATDIVRGAIALAYRLSEQRANDIQQLTDSDIGFFALTKEKPTDPMQPVNSVFTKPSLTAPVTRYLVEHPSVWEPLTGDRSEPIDIAMTLAGEGFHGILYPLARSGGGTLGFVIVLKSRTELLRPFRMIQQQVLWAGGACLLIASLFAWFIAQRITRPIIALGPIAQRIQDGDYPEPDVRFYNRHDEVGALYQAIIRMGKTLKDKADLENYLAELSASLDMDRKKQSQLQQLIDRPAPIGRGDPLQSTRQPQIIERTIAQPDATQLRSDPGTLLPVVTELAAEEQLLIPGSRFDERYEIVRPLGQGAMGNVQLVMDLDLNEQVALKIFYRRNLQGEALGRFKEEIRLARRITHRNIVRTFDFGVWRNHYYITMEYIHGFDLRSLINTRGPLAVKIAIMMARQICSAIIAAHAEGIIHRDLKPNNIIINKMGVLKIMDFGLALRINTLQNVGQEEDEPFQSNTTISGTPRYMAPEQFEGRTSDVRTDIYAIGAILHFILSGDAPFSGQSFTEISHQHRFVKPPHLCDLVDKFPEALDRIVYKALEKEPGARFQTVTNLLDALLTVRVDLDAKEPASRSGLGFPALEFQQRAVEVPKQARVFEGDFTDNTT